VHASFRLEFFIQLICVSGDMNSGDEVLEWLRKNRFRQPELNIFMYAVIALAITFVMYTAWLLSCFRPHIKQVWVGALSCEVEDLCKLCWVIQWSKTAILAQGYPMWSLSCVSLHLSWNGTTMWCRMYVYYIVISLRPRIFLRRMYRIIWKA
jgi:predicted nucleic acid-binding Zn ribbon protein